MALGKILGTALACVFLILTVRQVQPRYAAALSAAAGAVLLGMALGPAGDIADFIRELGTRSGTDTAFAAALKVTGIALLTDFAAQTCADAGEAGVARWVEWAGKTAMLLAALPMLRSVLELLERLVRI